MSELKINAKGIDIHQLIEAANDVLKVSKDDAEYFESLKKKKWYSYLWGKITFSKDTEIKTAQGVANITKLQSVIVQVLIIYSQQNNDVMKYITDNTEKIEELVKSNYHIQQQQSQIIDILHQLKYQVSEIPELNHLPFEDKKIIIAALRKFAGEFVPNDNTKSYLSNVYIYAGGNPDYVFDNLELIENLNKNAKSRLAVMLYEYMYLAKSDFDCDSEILDMISNNLKKQAESRVTKYADELGKEFFIRQFERKIISDSI